MRWASRWISISLGVASWRPNFAAGEKDRVGRNEIGSTSRRAFAYPLPRLSSCQVHVSYDGWVLPNCVCVGVLGCCGGVNGKRRSSLFPGGGRAWMHANGGSSSVSSLSASIGRRGGRRRCCLMYVCLCVPSRVVCARAAAGFAWCEWRWGDKQQKWPPALVCVLGGSLALGAYFSFFLSVPAREGGTQASRRARSHRSQGYEMGPGP